MPPTRRLVSRRVAFSYALDWIAILVFLLITYGFNKLTPNYHAFSLIDLNISHPLLDDTVSDTALYILSVIVPGICIFLVASLFVPGPAGVRRTSWTDLVRIKLWELNAGWLGLALSLATTLLVTQGMKNVIGKPRPDMLALCLPDTNNIEAYTVGGYGQDISPRWVLVNQLICQQTDKASLNDGFRSFPSGHSSTSFAGLFYLSLYLSSKFAVAFPHIPSWRSFLAAKATAGSGPGRENISTYSEDTTNGRLLGVPDNKSPSVFSSHGEQAAAAPLYLLFLPYIPTALALYISGSRYFDYRHHGFDIICGALIGLVTATGAFRFYHPRLSRGSGFSWRPRQAEHAFGVAISMDRKNDADGRQQDVELGALSGTRFGNSSLDAAQVDGGGVSGRVSYHTP